MAPNSVHQSRESLMKTKAQATKLDAAVQLEGHQVLKVLEPGASGKFGNCNSWEDLQNVVTK